MAQSDTGRPAGNPIHQLTPNPIGKFAATLRRIIRLY